MKKRTAIIRAIAGLAMLAAGITQAESLFPAQDYGELDSAGVPEGWQMNGKFEFKKLEDPDIQPSFSLTAKETGSVNAYSPAFAIAGGKSYVLTLKFRSSRFGETGYDKMDASLSAKFTNADGKDALSNFRYAPSMECPSPEQIGFSYTSVSVWTNRAISFTAPQGAVNARLFINLNNGKANDTRPEIQIGCIAVRELPNIPAGAKILDMQAAQLNPGPAFDKAMDGKMQNASSPAPGVQYPGGGSLLITKKDVKGNIGFGPYKKMPAGIYELCVRLKTSDNSSETPVFAARADGNPDGGVLGIPGKDFKKADEFQEFKFRFLKPGNDWLNLPCYKVAGCIITLDNLTVSPVKQFSPNDLDEYFLGK